LILRAHKPLQFFSQIPVDVMGILPRSRPLWQTWEMSRIVEADNLQKWISHRRVPGGELVAWESRITRVFILIFLIQFFQTFELGAFSPHLLAD